MSVREEFDEWAASGRDKGMEERHWHTVKHGLARMPVEEGETVLDLGTGSGYAARAVRETKNAGRVYGLDGSPEMAQNAQSYTDDRNVGFLIGDFDHLPFETDGIDHAFSMEAFYYANDPERVLEELSRILRPGGAFFCMVDYYEENVYSHEWQENISVDMTRWSAAEYREAFRNAGLWVAAQDNVPDLETDIPPASEFPIEHWDSRETMEERYQTLGTLLTVGVAR